MNFNLFAEETELSDNWSFVIHYGFSMKCAYICICWWSFCEGLVSHSIYCVEELFLNYCFEKWLCDIDRLVLQYLLHQVGHGRCYSENCAKIHGPFFINIRLTKDGVISERSARTWPYFSPINTNSHHCSSNVLMRNHILLHLECIFYIELLFEVIYRQ
jgi:hypothetical protein